MNFLNLFRNRKSKHAIEGAISDIEKKRFKLTCELEPSEKYK